MRYRIKTDAFGDSLYVGEFFDGEPVWVHGEQALLFANDEMAGMVAMAIPESTLEQEITTEPSCVASFD